MNKRICGFTLVELLVVISILGILATMLLPTVHRILTLAQEKACNSNLGVIGKTIQAYYHECNDLLPMNDAKDWGAPKDEDEKLDFLPGTSSTKRWWCNKVYPLGHRTTKLYRCASDSIHSSSSAVVECSYGFNDTLTDANSKGGDEIKTSLEINKPLDTFLVGHCSPEILERQGGVWPGINEDLVDEGAKWPKGHYESWDDTAQARLGRAGFLMAAGNVKVFTFAQVKELEDKNGNYTLFHID